MKTFQDYKNEYDELNETLKTYVSQPQWIFTQWQIDNDWEIIQDDAVKKIENVKDKDYDLYLTLVEGLEIYNRIVSQLTEKFNNE